MGATSGQVRDGHGQGPNLPGNGQPQPPHYDGLLSPWYPIGMQRRHVVVGGNLERRRGQVTRREHCNRQGPGDATPLRFTAKPSRGLREKGGLLGSPLSPGKKNKKLSRATQTKKNRGIRARRAVLFPDPAGAAYASQSFQAAMVHPRRQCDRKRIERSNEEKKTKTKNKKKR